MQLSYWEHDTLLEADFIVVGAGVIGLQTALELRERRPRDRILVLERGVLPAGASGRNAGFACFGSLTELLHDFNTQGEAATLALVERRWRGLNRLRSRLNDEAMGYEHLGGFELLLDSNLHALEEVDKINSKLRPLFGQDVFFPDNGALRASRFGPLAKALVRNPFEGQLHSGRLMRALSRLAACRGINIVTGVRVTALEQHVGTVRLHTSLTPDACFRAARVAICTNGATAGLLPQDGITPARGQVLVTEPVRGLPWRGTFHLEQGYYYFRNIGERVLLGGGRHLDFDAEATEDMTVTDTIQSALERLLNDTILPGRNARVDFRWAGTMGFSTDRRPVVRRVSEGIALGFGCNGMGVALGAEIAAETAALLM